MKHRSSREPDQRSAGHASRRQFLGTIVVGAAYGACSEAPNKMMGKPMGQPPMEEEPPAPRPTSPDARTSSPGPSPDAGPAGQPPASPDAAPSNQPPPDAAPVSSGRKASDQVLLGKTGLKVSRLAMGSGTHGSGGTSVQTRLGIPTFSRLLLQSYHEQGLNFWETADGYGSHPHLKEAIRQVGRDKVVVATKSHATTAQGMQADVERFLNELGTDHLDIVLLHAITSSTWTQQCAGAMEYLEMAKQKGLVRAHGISCHSLPALRLAARTPWVDVDFARINPARIQMDADPATVISVLREMKAAGKGVVGMKILGVGELANQMDTAIKHAVQLDAIDCFTIGFASYPQLQEVTGKIAQFGA